MEHNQCSQLPPDPVPESMLDRKPLRRPAETPRRGDDQKALPESPHNLVCGESSTSAFQSGWVGRDTASWLASRRGHRGGCRDPLLPIPARGISSLTSVATTGIRASLLHLSHWEASSTPCIRAPTPRLPATFMTWRWTILSPAVNDTSSLGHTSSLVTTSSPADTVLRSGS